jgi:hypothetical protein
VTSCLPKARLLSVLVACASACSCVGTTGGELMELRAYAAGPAEATGGALRFSTSRGYDVELSEARLFVSAVYLNRSRATSVSSDTSCTLAGIYVAQVLEGLEMDLLSAEPQPFPEPGFATSERAHTAEVWLADGDVNAATGTRTILRVAGTARKASDVYPFQGELNIGSNWLPKAPDPALPGAQPICKQRIVSPIPVELTPQSGRDLLLRVDPRGMFGNVEFSTLAEASEGAPDGVYRFADEAGANQASDGLYAGLHRSRGVYTLTWMNQESSDAK